MSRGFINKIKDLINIRKPIIWIKSYEEEEVEILIKNMLDDMDIDKVWSWTSFQGISQITYDEETTNFVRLVEEDTLDHMSVIEYIMKCDKSDNKYAFILKDVHEFTDTQQFIRAMRDIRERNNKGAYCPIIAISPVDMIPTEWRSICELVEYEYPSMDEIDEMLKMFENVKKLKIDNREQTKKILAGFSMIELSELISNSFNKKGFLDIEYAKERKIELVERSGLLTYKKPNVTMDKIGGNDNFKQWAEETKICMTEEAVELGIPQPKGYLALGIPGTSKTLMAEALAGEFNVPLLKLDMSKILSKMVGESEQNADRTIDLIKACAPCVLLVDECEKALGGVNSSNQSDSGVIARIFSKILDFLNDNKDVYVVMTSNDVSQLPPELTRTGRLDAIWYFGLPDEKERKEIFKIHFDKNNKKIDDIILNKCAKDSEGYTGAEIEHIVKNTIKKAYVESIKHKMDFEISHDTITRSIKHVIPISKSYAEKIYGLEAWVKDRALYASAKGESTRKRTTNFDDLL